ncbi:TPA: Holliday junction branch migration protein RuvA [Candidatus Nomurabacteria bacterium]|nr:MAG: Holliday junction ATP-dependent DNA helicase RuvA [Parcubacteria bacterium RAAC4_OD1_1]HCY26160.1 Holliday junction branch migration protein RuvA [Candidatus Nomurabacteria bacterium]
MIGRLKGNIVFTGDKFILIDVSGVGYKVYVSNETLSKSKEEDEVILFIYTAVRENSIDLYGFINNEDLSFFEMLLSVSGIGPKSALGILNIAPVENLARAISTGDTSYLNKVSGIGRKTAEKIVVELRDKLQSYKNENGEKSLRDEGDIIEALKSLGYSQTEAREVVKKISPEIEKTNEKIKEALRILNNH